MEELSISYIWIAAGIAFLALEAFGISGIGFFFAGLGALTTAVFIKLGITGEGSYLAQFSWFFTFTVLWAILLWKPIRKFQLGRHGHKQGYSNMVGDSATLSAQGLRPGEEGEAVWSGTIMRAKLAPGVKEPVAGGARVRIVEVQGIVLIVTPVSNA